MNSENEKQLEAAIHRELKALPDLAAPDSLARRVMSAIRQSPARPWYERSWQTWPIALQTVSLVVMLALFGGLGLAGWELSRAAVTAHAVHRLGEFASAFQVAGNVLAVLVNSMVLAVRKLGAGFMAACFFSLCLAYALCVGLGTVYVRLITGRFSNFRN